MMSAPADLQRKAEAMPGPSSFTPRSVKPSVHKKHFTLAMANKTLPLVRRIAEDIVHTHDSALELQAKTESIKDATKQTAAQRQLDTTMDRLQTLVGELTDVGCELKDYKTGLVDFLGRHQGRDVHLCWKLGEDKIGYWHELNEGFAGRKPISTFRESN